MCEIWLICNEISRKFGKVFLNKKELLKIISENRLEKQKKMQNKNSEQLSNFFLLSSEFCKFLFFSRLIPKFQIGKSCKFFDLTFVVISLSLQKQELSDVFLLYFRKKLQQIFLIKKRNHKGMRNKSPFRSVLRCVVVRFEVNRNVKCEASETKEKRTQTTIWQIPTNQSRELQKFLCYTCSFENYR